MHDTLRLGRVAGIGVGVHWSVVGMALLVASVLAVGVLPTAFPGDGWAGRWAAASVGAAVFAISLLLHELAHALVARRHGVGVDGITLWLLGGVARLTRQAPTPSAEFQIAVAGPVASAMVGVVLVGAVVGFGERSGTSLAWAVLLWVGLVNLVLAVFNLLPAAPLDGGRVVAAALWRRSGDAETARVQAARLGLLLGTVLVVVGVVELVGFGRLAGVATSAIGVFLISGARGEIAAAVVRGRLRKVTMGEIATPHPPPLDASLPLDRFLTWSDRAGPEGVFPVRRWDHQPVGWVSAQQVLDVGEVERSWVPLERVMVPDRLAPRAWSTEPVDDVLARLGNERPAVVVVLDPRTGEVVGTAGREQVGRLFRLPDLWGRDRRVVGDVRADPVRG